MKDMKKQNQKQSHQTQRKVLRHARQEESQRGGEEKNQVLSQPPELQQEMRVEVEQQKMVRRPGPLKDRSWKGQKSIPPRRMH